MTRKEFSSKSEALTRVYGYIPGFLGICFCLTFVGQFVSSYIERHYHTNHWDMPGNIFLLIFLFGGLIGMAYLEWNLAKKLGLRCAHCGEFFIKQRSRRVALLTGDCPKCKNKLFNDDNPGDSRVYHNLNRDEFKEKLAKFTRRSNRREIRLLAIAFSLMIACVPATKFFQRLVEEGGLDWVTLTEWGWVAGLILGTLLLSFLSIPIFAATGKFKLHVLPCPECGRALVGGAGQVAVDKGRCIYCGCGLFTSPPSQS